MRLFGIPLMALIYMSALVSATPDSAIAGPYNVSFDVGLTKAAYNVTINDPKDKEAYAGIYSISINQDAAKRNAKILINDDGSMPSAAVSSIFNIQNINSSEKEIDGVNGTLATGDISLLGSKIPYYEASYYPFKDTGVLLISNFPEKNSLRLLDSIHIELINTTEQNRKYIKKKIGMLLPEIEQIKRLAEQEYGPQHPITKKLNSMHADAQALLQVAQQSATSVASGEAMGAPQKVCKDGTYP
jgi:hypothetical protein